MTVSVLVMWSEAGPGLGLVGRSIVQYVSLNQYGVFGRFDLAALGGCHTLNVCYVSLNTKPMSCITNAIPVAILGLISHLLVLC